MRLEDYYRFEKSSKHRNLEYGRYFRISIESSTPIPVKLQHLLDDPTVRILRYLSQKGEVRYIEIQRNIKLSRSTINSVIHDLEDRRLVQRRLNPGKPIEVYYSTTAKGKEAFGLFEKLRNLIL